MGFDISGKKPTTNEGNYFGVNCWGWRPLNVLCEMASYDSKLKIDFSYWGSNDGKGLKTQKQCNELADAIDSLISNSFDFNENLMDDDDKVCVCMGSWCEAGTGRLVGSEKRIELDEQYEYGTIMFRPVVMSDGKLVEPSHSTSLYKIKEFITFLKGCGGFEIW